MSIQKKPIRGEAKERKLEAFLSGPAPEKEKIVYQQLRLPQSTVDDVVRLAKEGFPKKSLHAWYLEAVAEKLARERKD